MSLIIPMLVGAQTQIMLLHTFEGLIQINAADYSNKVSDPYILNDDNYENKIYYDNTFSDLIRQGIYYNAFLNVSTNSVSYHLWDKNFQEVGTLQISVPAIANYEVAAIQPTTKLFNDDNNYEYIVRYYLSSAYKSNKPQTEYINQSQKMIVVDKNGNIIYDFGTAFMFPSSAFTYLYRIDNKWIYVLPKQIYLDANSYLISYTTEIYQISKQSPQGLSQISPAHMPAYPNPAISEINIPSPNSQDVNIYDMNGRLVDTHNGNEEVVNVDVSGYPSGNYIYQTQGNSGVFIKQ
jgi:hypothetical protein